MSTHQLPDGRWICKFPAGTIKAEPKRTKYYFGRGEDGEAAAKAKNQELNLGVISRMESTPFFIELAEKYLKSKDGRIAATTFHCLSVHRFPKRIYPVIGHMQAHEINRTTLDDFVSFYKKQGLKNNTINSLLAYILAVLNHAKETGSICYNPVAGYKKLRNDDARIMPPSKPEFEAILEHAAPHLQRWMWLCYYTALRPGPVESQLKWSDVDFYNRIIMVTSARKGGPVVRNVPISEKFMELLKAWRQEDDAIKGAKYIIRWRGDKVDDLGVAWMHAKRKAGITRRLRPYDLRHYSATVMISNPGTNIKSVSKILGHSTVMQTLTVYAHVIDSQSVTAVECL